MDVRKRVGAMAIAIGAIVLACVPCDVAAQAAATGAARTAKWDELLPKDWDPLKQFRDKSGVVREGSVREMEMMEELRKAWDNAPTRPELNGTRLRLPGYVVPLDSSAAGLKEFLLVPYFGACIHSPPPPANQIVYVKLAKAAPIKTMDAVWVSGTLSTGRSDSPMGVSGYQMAGDLVEPYKETRTEK
ncbi:MAG: DUF3299 domain-containing protein [Burkholderiales bacterium]